MTYSTLTDLQAFVPGLVLSPATTPTAAQATEFLANCSREIDSALKSRGLQVPITAPDEFVADLVQLDAMGAAGYCLFIAFPMAQGPGQSPLGSYLTKTYQGRLSDLRKGIGVPVGVGVFEDDLSPRSYFTDIGAWSQGAEAQDVFGEPVNAQPAFRRETRF